jgi:hypothetical protein
LVNNVSEIVMELKPNNPAALYKGSVQLKDAVETIRISLDKCYIGQLQPYNLKEVPGLTTPMIK